MIIKIHHFKSFRKLKPEHLSVLEMASQGCIMNASNYSRQSQSISDTLIKIFVA